VALFALSACGGDPEAQETVGPTAGSDPSSTTQAYEPTLPPYTSDVDLTDEETEQVEETLLAIDEYIFYTASFSDTSNEKINELAKQMIISEDLRDAHLDAADNAKKENKKLTGSIAVTDFAVWDYQGGSYGYFGICLELDNWGLVSEDPKNSADEEGSLQSRPQLAEIEAHYQGDKPLTWNG
jgi:hypothetical protein